MRLVAIITRGPLRDERQYPIKFSEADNQKIKD